MLEHYQQARVCLGQSLGDPLCDLMLIIALTFAGSSITPQVAKGEQRFSGATKRKDLVLLAANMVTQMLWFLKPHAFPWDKDNGSILRILEITKKIGIYYSIAIVILQGLRTN